VTPGIAARDLRDYEFEEAAFRMAASVGRQPLGDMFGGCDRQICNNAAMCRARKVKVDKVPHEIRAVIGEQIEVTAIFAIVILGDQPIVLLIRCRKLKTVDLSDV
jgi:hypothetical protein